MFAFLSILYTYIYKTENNYEDKICSKNDRSNGSMESLYRFKRAMNEVATDKCTMYLGMLGVQSYCAGRFFTTDLRK